MFLSDLLSFLLKKLSILMSSSTLIDKNNFLIPVPKLMSLDFEI